MFGRIILFLQVKKELVFFFVLHNGVEVARVVYALAREWCVSITSLRTLEHNTRTYTHICTPHTQPTRSRFLHPLYDHVQLDIQAHRPYDTRIVGRYKNDYLAGDIAPSYSRKTPWVSMDQTVVHTPLKPAEGRKLMLNMLEVSISVRITCMSLCNCLFSVAPMFVCFSI